MKKMGKKFAAVMLCLTLVLSGMTTVFATTGESIHVQFNGEQITFSGVAPKIVEGHAMVPFRQTLEAMGAKVTYDKGTEAISATLGDKTISGTLGSRALTVTENGQMNQVELPVTPHLDGNQSSIYLPVRAIETGFGYAIGWDSWENTIVIIDFSPMFTAAQKDFSILGKLMTNEREGEKAYEMKGKIGYRVDLSLEDIPLTVETGMTLEGVQKQTEMEMTVTYQMDTNQLVQAIEDPELRAAMQEVYQQNSPGKIAVKMDTQTGDIWMNMKMMPGLDPGFGENVWYKMNLYDTYDGMGLDIRPLMMASAKGEAIHATMLNQLLSMMEINDTEFYSTMEATYTFLKFLLGDEAFTMESRNGEEIYTLKIDEKAILAAMVKAGAALDQPMGDLAADMEGMLSLLDFSGELIIKTKGEALTNYTMKGNYSGEEMSLTMEASGNFWDSKVKLSMDAKDLVKLVYDIDIQTQETNKTPNIKLPANAEVMDLNDIFEYEDNLSEDLPN